jgi:Flp pilus assembly protein TadD
MKRGSAQPTAAIPLERRYAVYFYIAVFFLCIGASFLLYANSLGNEFVFDDLPLIIDNALIKDIGNIGKVIGWESGYPLYRPVRYVSYMLDYWLWGLKPAGYHVANILYHGIAGFILFLVLVELAGNRLAALAGTVLFISHPVLTDSVTYISGRRDVLVGLFYLLSFYCFIRYRKEPRLWYAVLTGIFFLLALGSKEMGITLPAVCLAYDFTQSFRQRGAGQGLWVGMRQAVGEVIRKNWKLYLPLAVLAGIFFYSKIFLYYPSLKSSYYGGSAISNFATVVRIICYYIKLVLFPVVLHADYSYNAFALSQSFLEWRVLGAGLVVVGLLGVTLWSLARQGLVFFGGMWFFITLVPVSQIFPHHELMAEHYLYVPLAGVMIMVLPLLAYVLEKKQKAALGLIMLIAVLFGLRTIERNRDWRDGMTLWSGVVAAAPESARGHDNLGTEYVKRKDYQTALKHYQEAVRLRPEHAIFHNNLGRAYGMLGDIKNAEAELRKAVDLNPTLAEAMNNLGIVFFQKADYTTAAWLFALSINQKPDSRVSFNLAKTRLKLGQVKEAITEFETTIRLQPDHTDAYRELAIIFAGQGNRQESLRCLRKALELEQDATKRQQLEAAIKKIEHGG